jgi:hypothetical protein
MLIAVQGKNGARPMIRIILKTKARKEEKIKIAGYRPSAETAVFESATGRASARIRSDPILEMASFIVSRK